MDGAIWINMCEIDVLVVDKYGIKISGYFVHRQCTGCTLVCS